MSRKIEITLELDNNNRVAVADFYNSLDANEYTALSKEQFVSLVLPKILNADPTILRSLNRGSEFKWTIKQTNEGLTTQRLKQFVAPFIFPDKIVNRLYAYQKKGVAWLLSHPVRILADDMGLGKTVQVYAGLQQLFHAGDVSKALLFAPNSLLRNWQKEAKSWAPNLVIGVADSKALSEKSELARKIESCNLLLAPYSIAKQLADTFHELSVTFDLMVCDEAHKLRKMESLANLAVSSIPTKRKWLVTGTPLERDEQDIANILAILEPKKFRSGQLKEKSILHSALGRLSLRREKKDVLGDLPSVTRHTHEIELLPAQRENYKKTMAAVAQMAPHERISNITKLSIATGTTINDENAKLEKMISIISDAETKSEKTIVFSNFNEILLDANRFLKRNAIKAMLYNGQLDEQERFRILELFSRKTEISVLLLNSRIGSEGLTLTNANNVIFLNEWWNPSSNRQAEDRVNRIGQQKEVHIHILRAANTIDMRIANILQNKSHLESEFLAELTSQHYE